MRDGSPLAREWSRLKAIEDPTRRGHLLETFVGSLFGSAHFEVVRSPGAGGHRQVDLLATMGAETYLVEAKWWKRKPGVGEIQALEDRLKETPASVIGLFVSYSGFTQGAINRVQSKPKRPILLVTGEEPEHAIRWDGDFLSILRHKRDTMLVHSKVGWASSRQRQTRNVAKGALASTPEKIVLLDGTHTTFLHCRGEFGQFVFVRELPDIDWVPGSGFGVTLDLAAAPTDQAGLLELLGGLSSMGWISEKSRWSIQQAEDTWHGSGADRFASVLADWRARYSGQNEIHHTEEFAYFDLCDHLGFYTLTGQIAAHEPRIVWRASLSFQLSGVPIDPVPLQHLAQRLNERSAAYFRPRNADSVSRHHVRRSDGVPLDVVVSSSKTTRTSPTPTIVSGRLASSQKIPSRGGPGRAGPSLSGGRTWPLIQSSSYAPSVGGTRFKTGRRCIAYGAANRRGPQTRWCSIPSLIGTTTKIMRTLCSLPSNPVMTGHPGPGQPLWSRRIAFSGHD